MQVFITEAANQPGELARHTEAIASRGINLSSIVCVGMGDRGGAAFLAADEAGLRTAIMDAGLAYREVPVIPVAIEDRPGTAASAARTLADAGVNIEFLAPVDMKDGKVTLAIGVDNVESARQALGDLVTEWSMSREGAAAR
jgi:hypothetical protein